MFWWNIAQFYQYLVEVLINLVFVVFFFLQMEAYKEKLVKEAEKIVLEEFPKKVIEFNNLLEVTIVTS